MCLGRLGRAQSIQARARRCATPRRMDPGARYSISVAAAKHRSAAATATPFLLRLLPSACLRPVRPVRCLVPPAAQMMAEKLECFLCHLLLLRLLPPTAATH
jgi:hypothetical protein